jgi:hypothetical protein
VQKLPATAVFEENKVALLPYIEKSPGNPPKTSLIAAYQPKRAARLTSAPPQF